MSGTLIIGLGNLDRGDDAAGILVARGLADRGIEAIGHTGGTLDLMEIWENAGEVIIVDAVLSGAPVGTMHKWDARTIELPNDALRSSTHALGLTDAIELARALDRLPAKVTIYGIEAARFVAGTPPSPGVLAGIERAVEQIALHVASSI